jgi:predicted glycoside hydrolase/deacetylase ChbG (UPF0249 family)
MRARELILCADDFAESVPVCRGVTRLVDAGRLSAVSCFSDAPLWPEEGPKLLARSRNIAVGLHFNLTQAFGFGEKPLGFWIVASLLRRIDTSALRAVLRRQIDSFRRVAGRLPDFIDGHQHVHAFPVVRSVLAEIVEETPIPIRNVSVFFGPTDAPVKRFVIKSLATLGGHRRPDEDLNAAFGGDYSFSPRADYARLFAGWLASAPDGGLLMCHPAATGDDPADPFLRVRQRELEFLASDALGDLLEKHGVRLATGIGGKHRAAAGAGAP